MIPPPPGSRPGLRKPALAERSPRLLAAGVAAANVLDAWMRRTGTSNVDLALEWCLAEKIVRELRTRDKPLHVAHILAIPSRKARSQLFALLEDVELEPSNAA